MVKSIGMRMAAAMLALAVGGLSGCGGTMARQGGATYSATAPASPKAASSKLPFIHVRMLIIVRHDDIDVAEKRRMGDETPLTERGTERSEELEHALKDAGITKIVTSTALRTEETAGPLAKELGITPVAAVSHDEPGPTRSEADGVVNYLAETGKPDDVVLLVHHHSVIPGLMKDLGYTEPPFVDATEFDRIYVVIPDEKTETYRVLRLRYGGSWGGSGATRVPGAK